MAFDNVKILPNYRGIPRERDSASTACPHAPRQLTQAEKDRCWRYARDQRISLAQAIRDLGLEE